MVTMDIDRIQKINALALDLLKKGLAPDREAAVAQAEQVYRGQGASAEDYAGFQKRYQETRGESQNTVTGQQQTWSGSPIASGASGNSGTDIAPEKIKDILQQNTTFLVKKIKEFQEKVEVLERELGAVKNQMLYRNVVREMPQQENQRETPQHEDREEVPIVSASSGAVIRGSESGNSSSGTVPKQEVKSEPHPRSGNWKGEDVSIEKFFYMGGKR